MLAKSQSEVIHGEEDEGNIYALFLKIKDVKDNEEVKACPKITISVLYCFMISQIDYL